MSPFKCHRTLVLTCLCLTLSLVGCGSKQYRRVEYSGFLRRPLVAGAVTGGGLTIIANAPNPAGIAILRSHFDDKAVHPLGLLLAALPPTIIAALAFRLF